MRRSARWGIDALGRVWRSYVSSTGTGGTAQRGPVTPSRAPLGHTVRIRPRLSTARYSPAHTACEKDFCIHTTASRDTIAQVPFRNRYHAHWVHTARGSRRPCSRARRSIGVPPPPTSMARAKTVRTVRVARLRNESVPPGRTARAQTKACPVLLERYVSRSRTRTACRGCGQTPAPGATTARTVRPSCCVPRVSTALAGTSRRRRARPGTTARTHTTSGLAARAGTARVGPGSHSGVQSARSVRARTRPCVAGPGSVAHRAPCARSQISVGLVRTAQTASTACRAPSGRTAG